MEVVAGKKRKRTNGAQKRAGDAQSDASESSNFGFKKWIDAYKARFLDAKKVQAEIDAYMKKYDEEKDLREQKELELTNQPDEEGWIQVTKKNRKSNMPMTERNIEKLKTKQRKKQQQMQLVNFYAFQMKNSKKDYISQLKKKFEEDKKTIEAMKQRRKFNPF